MKEKCLSCDNVFEREICEYTGLVEWLCNECDDTPDSVKIRQKELLLDLHNQFSKDELRGVVFSQKLDGVGIRYDFSRC